MVPIFFGNYGLKVPEIVYEIRYPLNVEGGQEKAMQWTNNDVDAPIELFKEQDAAPLFGFICWK